MLEYSFGVPGPAIWGFHILLGILLLHTGLSIVYNKQLPMSVGLIYVTLGALVPLYHAHLWYLNGSKN